MTVSTPTTIGNLDIQTGGSLVMSANLDVMGSLTLGTTINTGTSTLGLGCEATVSGASAANYVIGNIRKDFCAANRHFSYPTGTANGYSPVRVNVTALPTNPSSLLIKANQGNRAGMYPFQSAARYWSLSLTGALTADLMFTYLDPTDINGTEANYKLYRFVGATPTAVTPFTLDTVANTMSANGQTTFSDWAIGNLGPSAANVSIAGKVEFSNGRGIPRAIVTLTDAQGNVRSARTNNFGYFRLNDVGVGQNYTITAVVKGLQFTPQVLSVDDDINGLVLVPSN